jgi:hypothetical protein
MCLISKDVSVSWNKQSHMSLHKFDDHKMYSCVGVNGRRGSGPEWWLCIQAAASEFMVGICFMRRSRYMYALGDCLVSLVRRGCQLGRRCLGWGSLTFRPGRRPRMLVRWPWSTSSLSCVAWAAGNWVVRRCGSSSSGGTLGQQPQKVVSKCWMHWDLVSCGRWGCLDAGRRRQCGAGLASSSLLERPVFAPPIAFTMSSLRLGGGCLVLIGSCCVGFAPVVSVLAQFSVNRPDNYFLLN